MAVTGIALILFLTFHCAMNIVALFSGEAYNMICEMLGANWYAVLATIGLAALAVCHIVFAFILTAQNRSARGESRYEVSTEVNSNGLLDVAERWASSNMLVLGIIILCGLLLHLANFWYNMMFAEIVGMPTKLSPSDGFGWIQETFSNPVFVVLYLVWFCAIWFHLAHGFWSSMHTLGMSGKIWQKRMQCIGLIYVTLLMLGFTVVVLGFAFGCAPSLCCVNGADCCQAAAACCQ
jgi:succinate dehydrogenase / fumarate reductase cytochrome b subunit